MGMPELAMAGGEDVVVEDSIHMTMWESTGIPPKTVENLNRARAVIVPCRANAAWYKSAGVVVPIRIVPLGIDPAIYRPGPRPQGGDFVVLANARFSGGGHRKGGPEMIAAFVEALGDREDCRLVIKAFPDCPIVDPGHPRIAIDRTIYDDAGLADWYRRGSVFFSLTKGEGWGMPPLEAMGCGLPVIGPIHSGLAEFLDERNCYPVAWDLAPAQGTYYAGHGDWMVPRHECAVEQLRSAYSDPDTRRAKGEAARLRALEFTWDSSGMKLEAVLREFGLVGTPAPAPVPAPIERPKPWTMARDFASAMVTQAAHVLAGGEAHAPEEVRAMRLAACLACPRALDGGHGCSSCGCGSNPMLSMVGLDMTLKRKLATSKCPEGKW